MSPTEWAWLYDVKAGQRMYGKMTEAEVEAIYAEAYGDAEGEEE